MTPNEFRKIALGFPEAVESAHMHHPDFRVAGKIFATLGYPDERHGMVKLDPQDQKRFIRETRGVFEPAKGAWGLRGSTVIDLGQAKPATVREALTLAWRGIAPSRLVKDQESR